MADYTTDHRLNLEAYLATHTLPSGLAKLAKAVGVIDWALIAWDDHNKHGYNMQGDWVSDARTTLAELTGGNP